ncbi:MAG TPA: porin [Myxococcota bacterium]|nr:porin [Myxococcota bacterium]
MFLLALVATSHAGEASYGKGFTIEDGDWKLKIGARVQARYTFESPTDDLSQSESYFSIPRARLKLSGDAGPRLGYYFQADFGQGQVALKDFLVDYELAEGISLVAGQYKKSFSRQQLSSSSSLQFTERALTDEAFGAGRDIGVSVLGTPEGGGVGWALGVFNGTRDTRWFAPVAVARVSYDSSGFKGYKEPDLKGGGLRYSLGAGVQSEFDADGDDSSCVAANLDYILKVQGFSTSGAVYVGTVQSGGSWTDQAYSALGFHAQAGYVVAERVEPVLRYGQILPDGAAATHELGAGLNVYGRGHDSKLQTGAIYTTSGGAGEVFASTTYQFQF